jgi:hypothetical protein
MAGLPEIEVPGCDPGCRHEWQVQKESKRRQTNLGNGGTIDPDRNDWIVSSEIESAFCHLCGGWRGSLGLEPTVEIFVGHIVLIWRALWKVLRDDGTCFLNFGDSYAGGRTGRDDASRLIAGMAGGHGGGNIDHTASNQGTRSPPPGLKPKDLIGIPWRVAFALQADGWYLRSDIIWAKGLSFCAEYSGSCMPESVRDRPTKGHEYVFLLAKSKRYYYDGDGVRENHSSIDRLKGREPNFAPHQWIPGNTFGNNNRAGGDGVGYNPAGRNLRTVWAINPGNFKGAHFATFPPALVEPMIKAGTSERGCCPSCGAQWERVTEREQDTLRPKSRPVGASRGISPSDFRALGQPQQGSQIVRIETTGFRPTCTCGTEYPIPQEELDADPTLLDDFEIEPFPPIPCTVLDPFLGSGTVADVARQLGRRWIGIELSKSYCDDHIIPRLSEPLLEWAEKQPDPDPEPVQMELL